MSLIRVLVADDEPVIREALSRLIDSEPELQLVGAAADASEAIDLAGRSRPDVALVDVKMPAGGGPYAVRGIRRRSPQTRVVVLSAYSDRDTVVEMLRAGASGYLVKGTAGGEIVDAVVGCAHGQSKLSSEIAGEVVAELTSHLEREERVAEQRRSTFARVRCVLDGDGLAIVFQPVINLRTGRTVGVEAFARFPGERQRGPEEWFADAEDVGLRVELERYAARRAVAHLAALKEDLFLAINLSPAAVGMCARELADNGSGRLVIEITEHARVDDYEVLRAALEDARSHRIRFAVDDAGAGFASLSHILQITPEFIKIDGSLARQVEVDAGYRAMTRALIAFADELGATIVAEGIETREQLEALRALGIRYGQGYYLARPRPLSEVLLVAD